MPFIACGFGIKMSQQISLFTNRLRPVGYINTSEQKCDVMPKWLSQAHTTIPGIVA